MDNRQIRDQIYFSLGHVLGQITHILAILVGLP